MSYCRFSSDNWKSDVYCYEDIAGGWTIHVAGMKIITPLPKIASIKNKKAWLKSVKAQEEALDNAIRVPINLPCDGKTFQETTLENTIARLQELKSMGYHVPSYAIKELKEELSESKSK